MSKSGLFPFARRAEQRHDGFKCGQSAALRRSVGQGQPEKCPVKMRSMRVAGLQGHQLGMAGARRTSSRCIAGRSSHVFGL